MPRKSKHYINNRRFHQELVVFLNTPEGSELPLYICECVSSIANRLASKPNFAGYTYKDEMIADGIENALSVLRKYNPDKTENPFAYFTQIIYNAFLRRIHMEKRQSYIKHKSLETHMILNDIPMDTLSENIDYDQIEKLVEKFEGSTND